MIKKLLEGISIRKVLENAQPGIEHSSDVTGKTYAIGHIMGEDGKSFDITVLLDFNNESAIIAAWWFGGYDPESAEEQLNRIDNTPI